MSSLLQPSAMEDPEQMETLPWGCRERMGRRVKGLNRLLANALASEAEHLMEEQVIIRMKLPFFS